MSVPATTSQTVGPYFQIGLKRFYVNELAVAGVSGERVEIEGKIFDGDGEAVPDGVVEIWQADADGKYAQAEEQRDKHGAARFRGFGRTPTEQDGTFRFQTIKPGRVPGPDGKLQAPHIVVSVFTRGLLRRLVTRIYFPHDAANEEDYALNLVEASRRATLIAKKSTKRAGLLEWNVVLQGPSETVFFDC
ncbi:MAG TPA: protocatechuate 3,4-dioxygenase subunit alpha [Candidatus Acidoferrum sp.]|jgi:protocatechuate 3,4-dioxygenase alpha subunit